MGAPAILSDVDIGAPHESAEAAVVAAAHLLVWVSPSVGCLACCWHGHDLGELTQAGEPPNQGGRGGWGYGDTLCSGGLHSDNAGNEVLLSPFRPVHKGLVIRGEQSALTSLGPF